MTDADTAPAPPIGLVLDCREPERLAEFWAPALGYARIGAAGNYVLLRDPERRRPKLLLQRVAEEKPGKNRMHLDLDVGAAAVDGEVARLEGLGAVRLEDDAREELGTRWVVMADPEGNEFCVCATEQQDG